MSEFTVGLGGITTNTTYSESNMIIAYNNLKLQVDASHMGPTEAPIGDSTKQKYSPVTFEINSATFTDPAYIAFQVTAEKHWDNGSTAGYLDRYWSLGTSNISSYSIDLAFKYDNVDVQPVEADIYCARYNGTWFGFDRTNTATNTMLAMGVTNIYAQWSGVSNQVLPVELVTFTASLNRNAVALQWKTATETNNFGFEIQKSRDGKHWHALGFVEGHGTSNTPWSYSFIDPLTAQELTASTLSYRLKQIDRDGTEHFSSVATIPLLAQAATPVLLQNYPNPFASSTNISFALPYPQTVSIVIYDVTGREVRRLLERSYSDAGTHTVPFVGASLPSGMYICELRTESGSIRKTMSLNR